MGISLEKTKSMNEKEFFFAMTKQTIGVTTLFCVFALIIFLFGKLSWWLGIIAFVIFGVVCLISFFQSALTSILGIFMSAFYFGSVIYTKFVSSPKLEAEIIKGVSIADQSYVLSGAIFQFVSSLVMIVINVFLYKFFFPSQL